MVTGRPRSGKSTLVKRVVEKALGKGMKVGGIMTPELKEGNVRIGFLIVDVFTGESAVMAKSGKGFPRIGKYVVYTENISRLGVNAIRRAVKEADLIIIDEIGKMELLAGPFIDAVKYAVSSEKPFLGTIGVNVDHPLEWELKSRRDVELIFLTRENWYKTYIHVLNMLNLS